MQQSCPDRRTSSEEMRRSARLLRKSAPDLQETSTCLRKYFVDNRK